MSEKRIQDAINSVEPEAGAKERMYQNILKKAQQQSAPAEAPVEKKKKPIAFVRYALPIAACFCLLVIGLTRFLPGSSPVSLDSSNLQGGNPFVEVDGSDDFLSIGIRVEAPSDAENAVYTIIDGQIAEICFEQKGKEFVVRASAQSGDFSGLNGNEEELETIDATQNAVLSAVRIDDTQWYKITWTNGKVNYCLYATDGADREQTIAVYESIKK